MEDGIALETDVFRPIGDGRYLDFLSCKPDAKGQTSEDVCAQQWKLAVFRETVSSRTGRALPPYVVLPITLPSTDANVSGRRL
jgi:hypothetical protein